MLRIISNKKFKKYIALSVMIIFITAISMIGATFAWFTSGSDIFPNIFRAGTIQIDVTDVTNGDDQTTVFDTDKECITFNYEIENSGTKAAHLRVMFDGHWERTYHTNKACASTNGGSFEASDSAHFKYNDNQHFDFNPVDNSTAGFTDEELLGPVSFNTQGTIAGGANSGYGIDESGGNIGTHLIDTNSGSVKIEAPGEVFKIGENYPQYSLTDPAQLTQLFGPSCLKSFKVNLEDVTAGEINVSNGFEVLINNTDNTSGEVIDFSFKSVSGHLIYHVFVKGGSAGHRLYTYYIEESKQHDTDDENIKSVNIPEGNNIPFQDDFTEQYDEDENVLLIDPSNLSENGVTEGSGLKQVGKGWSHAVFFYCDPPELPDLELIKLVSLDGGASWYTSQNSDNEEHYNKLIELLEDKYNYTINDGYDYEDISDWPVSNNVIPKFQIVVANTGNVSLDDINVTDDYFTNFNYTIDLDVGEVWFGPQINYDDYLEPLPTDMISIKLANDTGWTTNPPNLNSISLREYFYYNDKIESGATVNLNIEVCVDTSNLGGEYSDAIFNLHAYFEAIQFSNDMDITNWDVQIPINAD